MKTRILHVSDFHLGCKSGIKSTIDDKEHILKDKKEYPIADFFEIIKDFEVPCDYMIFSGDIIHWGDVKQFDPFVRMLFGMITGPDEKMFPKKDHIVFVPGNHDTAKEDKWKLFNDMRGEFVIPWFETAMKKNNMIREIGTKIERMECKGYFFDPILPFTIDFERRIIIYALNSASLCNEEINGKKIDCPRITEEELMIFKVSAEKMRKKIGVDFEKYLFIAVLHHQITTLPTFEEIKSYEIISNAGEIKKILCEQGVKLVLHGHKHWPEIYIDTAISGGGALTVISGGSICQEPNRKEQKAGFFVIEFDSDMPNQIDVKYCPIIEYVSEKDSFIDEGYIKLPNKNIKYYKKRNVYKIDKLYKKIEKIMLNTLIIKEERCGWNKYINSDNNKIGFFGTAIGIGILSLIGCNNHKYILNYEKLKNTLQNSLKKDGGYNHSGCKEDISSIEGTCWAIRAFKAMHMWREYKEGINALLNMVNDLDCKNIFELSLILTILTEHMETFEQCEMSSAIQKIYQCLISEYMISEDEKKDFGNILYAAHAILACNKYAKYVGDEKNIKKKNKYVVNWIYNQIIQKDVSDIIGFTRSDTVKNGNDSFEYSHYAPPWLLCALLESGYDPADSCVIKLVKCILLYEDKTTGLFRSGKQYNQGFSVWETYDSIFALQAYLNNIMFFE